MGKYQQGAALDSQGNIIGVLGTYEDITQRKIAEKSSVDNERRLRWPDDAAKQVPSTGMWTPAITSGITDR